MLFIIQNSENVFPEIAVPRSVLARVKVRMRKCSTPGI